MKNRPLIGLALTLFGCRGFATADGEPNNVIVIEDRAYVSLGGEGVGRVAIDGAAIEATFAPPAGLSRVDDLASTDGLLFLLDGDDGRLAVTTIDDPSTPLSPAVEVDVGPYAGVSAGGGRVVVSGGTRDLTVHTYDTNGLSAARSTIDTGRGQPDVLVSPDGTIAYVSSDFSDDVDDARFGITTLALFDPPEAPRILDRVGLRDAGFTGGTGCPANFPIETALHGDRLLVAHGGGLAFIDVNDPSNLVLDTVLDVGVEATSVDVFGDEAFVVGVVESPTFVVVDISGDPTIATSTPLDPNAVPTGVAANASGTFIAANAAGVIRP